MGHAHNYITARPFRAGHQLNTVGSRLAAPAASACAISASRRYDVRLPFVLRDG